MVHLKNKIFCNNSVFSETIVYAVAWLIIFSIPWLSHFYSSVDMRLVVSTWLHMIPFLLIFLLNDLLLLKYLFFQNHKLLYVTAILLLLVAVWFGIQPMHPAGPHIDHLHKPPFDMFRITNVIIASCVILANIAIKMYIISVKKDMQMLKIRNEQISTELKSLKYQINPHFLMNTLNNIQALIDIDTAKAYETIQELSRMMRYVLYEENDKEVPLNREIDFMNNFIKLMRIRYPQHVEISVNFPNSLSDSVTVPPLLFITFVENAFKHGISYKEDSMVSISLEVTESYVCFKGLNSKQPKKSPSSLHPGSGIGLDNVKRRLHLLYGNKYSLVISDNQTSFVVQLEIPLNKSSQNDTMHSDR